MSLKQPSLKGLDIKEKALIQAKKLEGLKINFDSPPGTTNQNDTPNGEE